MDKQETLKDNTLNNVKDGRLPATDSKQYDQIYKAVLLKTERLVSAIYLITGLMDNKETIKWELRSVSTMSVSDLYCLSNLASSKGLVSDRILNKISNILSLLEISLTGSLISQMNYSILKEEYLKFKDILIKFQLTDGINSLALSGQFFEPDITITPQKTFIIPNNVPKEFKADAIKDIMGVSFIKKDVSAKGTHKLMSEYEKDKDKENKIVKTDKTARQDLILKVIKSEGGYTIKDIINEVSLNSPDVDCSDKTIQRDLLFLVSNGSLKKSGERRWSRYFKIL